MKVFAEKDNVNDEEVIVIKIYFKNGEKIKKGDHILDLETSKTAIEVESPEDGYLKIFVNEDQEIPIGKCLFEIFKSQSELTTKSNNEDLSDLSKPSTSQDYIFSKEAKEKLDELEITDYFFEKKMVSLEDVEALISKDEKDTTPEETLPKSEELPQANKGRKILPKFSKFIIKKHSLRKRAEIKNLSVDGNLSTQSVIGITIKTLPSRSYQTPYLFKDSISDLVSYESAKILFKYPELNSFYINEKEYGQYEEIRTGFSFDNDSNLKVFSIKNADTLSLSETQNKIQELLELYESNQTLDEELLASATLTVSDLSNFGASFMLPLVSNNQSSIIGITRLDDYNCSLFVGFDHKISSGLYVSKFLKELKENIESHFINEDSIDFMKCDKCEMSGREAKSLNNTGFITMLGFDGKKKNICENCFHGH